MADISTESRSQILALSERIRELEAQLIRLPGGGRPEVETAGNTNACTNCGTNCTNCRGDRFIDVLLPGEEAGLSGGELVKRVQAGRLRLKGGDQHTSD
jgi:hypothetical protein